MSKGGGRLSRLFPKLFGGDKEKATDRELKGPVCIILFLDDTEQRILFKTSWKGQVLFDLVCDQVNIFEKDYFGLRFVDSAGQTHWVDHGKSLSSQLRGCSTPHKFYFCVKYYAADPCKLKEEITRYLVFLQVKRDILQGRLPVTFDEAAELCAYAVQSELGDFEPRINTQGYVSEFSFVPNQTEELENRIAAMHRRCIGATPLMAEHRFLEKSKWLEMYGVDLHPVQGESSVEYFLGLTPTGVVVYKHKTKVASYFWPRVTKASRKSKIFMIKVKDKSNDEHVYAFELSSKSACKHLWKCCLEHHTFFRLNQAKDKETRPTKVLRSLSSSSNRGQSEKQAALLDQIGRQEPNVLRVTSRRQQRRVNSESRLNTDRLYDNSEGGLITLMGQPQPVRAPRHRSLPELQGKESPRSVKSAPWESKYDYGLYTSGHESPVEHSHHSRRSRAMSGSDSESGISQRKKYFPSRKESDNESDGSTSRRRRREMDSDSGSEVSFTHVGHSKRQPLRTLNDHNRNNVPILYPFHDKNKAKNGSIPSLHSAPVGEFKQQRRRRRRSKSPGSSKQLPEELKQHLDFNLVDTEGMTEDQLQDIAYTKVETKSNLFRVKYSPKFRQKIWASRRKSFGDADRPLEPSSNADGFRRQDSRNTDPSGAYGRSGAPNQDNTMATGNNENDRHRNQQKSLPQNSQAGTNCYDGNFSYNNPVYFNNGTAKSSENNNKGVSTNSQNFAINNNKSSFNSSGNSNSELRSGNYSYHSNNSRQPLNSSKSSRTNEYGYPTPSRNMQHDLKDSMTDSIHRGESSPSVRTRNSPHVNTLPNSRPHSYHQHHHQHSPHQHSQSQQMTSPRSDFQQHTSLQQHGHQQHTPPLTQRTPPYSQRHTFSNNQQQPQDFMHRQKQTPPRPTHSTHGLHGGSFMGVQGNPSISSHDGNHRSNQSDLTPPHYRNSTHLNDDGFHAKGHSGHWTPNTNYNVSHNYQSNTGAANNSSSSQTPRRTGTNTYNPQNSSGSQAHNHGQSFNRPMMARGQRPPPGYPPPHNYSPAPHSTTYRSDLVTEL